MRGGLARDLLIFAIGLVLGYFFAVYGGAKLVQSIAGSVPEINLSRPAIVLILIAVVVVALIFMSRGRK
jgi:amino acid permease